MKAQDIHELAEKNRIAWDDDPVFMMICEQLTGKAHLDSMDSAELQMVQEEIATNPAVFTKKEDYSYDHVFSQNHDYNVANFLDILKRRRRKAK